MYALHNETGWAMSRKQSGTDGVVTIISMTNDENAASRFHFWLAAFFVAWLWKGRVQIPLKIVKVGPKPSIPPSEIRMVRLETVRVAEKIGTEDNSFELLFRGHEVREKNGRNELVPSDYSYSLTIPLERSKGFDNLKDRLLIGKGLLLYYPDLEGYSDNREKDRGWGMFVQAAMNPSGWERFLAKRELELHDWLNP